MKAKVDAQSFINKLRVGSYLSALEFKNFISTKYQMYKKELGEDEILPLMIYELSQTDFSSSDLEKLYFLDVYLPDRTENHYRNSLVSFIGAALFALEMKEKEPEKVANLSMAVNPPNTDLDIEQITEKKFNDVRHQDSDFSKLTRDASKNVNLPNINSVVDSTNYINKMTKSVFEHFESDIQIARNNKIPLNTAPIDARLVNDFLNATPNSSNLTKINQVDQYKQLKKVAESAAALGHLDAFKKACNISYRTTTHPKTPKPYLEATQDQHVFLATAISCNQIDIIKQLIKTGSYPTYVAIS